MAVVVLRHAHANGPNKGIDGTQLCMPGTRRDEAVKRAPPCLCLSTAPFEMP